MTDISHSRKVNAIIIILGSMAVILVIFALGVYVGYQRAIFASGRSDNYYRDFMGGMSEGTFAPGMPGNTHGVVGTVIDVGSSSIIVEDQNNDEESVAVSTSTVIRMMDKTIDVSGLSAGEGVAVIGEPNGNGQIDAHFVRIFPSTSPLPPPTVVSGTGSSTVIIIHTL